MLKILQLCFQPFVGEKGELYLNISGAFHTFSAVITHWEQLLLDCDWLRDCEFISNLRANSVIRGKLQISRAKSVILNPNTKRIND